MDKFDIILCIILCTVCVFVGFVAGAGIQGDRLQKQAVALHFAHFVPESESSNKFVWFSNTMWQVKE